MVSHNGLLKLRTALKVQVTHKWSLVIACITNDAILGQNETKKTTPAPKVVKVDSGTTPTRPAKSTALFSSLAVPVSADELQLDFEVWKRRVLQSCFVSLQLQKVKAESDGVMAKLLFSCCAVEWCVFLNFSDVIGI